MESYITKFLKGIAILEKNSRWNVVRFSFTEMYIRKYASMRSVIEHRTKTRGK